MKKEFKRSQLGSFWSRVFALIFDVMVVGVVFGGLSVLINGEKGSLFSLVNAGAGSGWLDWVGIILFWAYNVVMIKMFGSTVGKMALGLKVTDEEGNAPDWTTIIIREVVGKMVSLIILGIGYLMVIWDDNRQALHDKIAETLVVKVGLVK